MQAIADIRHLPGMLGITILPLSLGGWIGYAAAGVGGAVCGVLIAMALAIGVRAWAESGG